MKLKPGFRRSAPLFPMFLSYLRGHLHLICAFGLVYFLFFLIPALYHLPLTPMLYAGLLSLTALLFFLLWRFVPYYERHVRLTALLRHCTDHLGELPPPRDLPERDYQAMVRVLSRAQAEAVSHGEEARSDALHYYTLWAHQIKTPISAMRLLIQEQETQGGDPAFPPALSQELFKIEQYVDMVLQYARLESGSTDLVLSECAPADLAAQAVRKTSTLLIHKQIGLSLPSASCRCGIPLILTDEKWMVFVLEQLLTNAVKYTPADGTVTLSITADSSSVTLTIQDTGIGIRPEDLPRVFEWGFTGYNGREDKRSTGIGLYLCRQITRRLGHELRMESTLGKGTRVSLLFSTERLPQD